MPAENATTAPTDTRDALVLAAEERLMTEGWAALRMRDLAAAVGIRAPSIYHHFATKADLGMAVVTHLHDETKSHIAKMSDGRASLKDRLAGFRTP